MTVTVTVRPGGACTEVCGRPFGKSGAGHGIVEDAITPTRSGQVIYSNGAFTVARPHTVRLIEALAKLYGRILVIH